MLLVSMVRMELGSTRTMGRSARRGISRECVCACVYMWRLEGGSECRWSWDGDCGVGVVVGTAWFRGRGSWRWAVYFSCDCVNGGVLE